MLPVVLDTNCLVSALLFSRNNLKWLRELWQRQAIVPLVCKDTVSELLRVLAYPKFKLTQQEQEILLADFLPYTQVVQIAEVPKGLPCIRDAQDQIFLTLAVVGKAEALITGDQDLLVWQDRFSSPPIMTLTAFYQWYSARFHII
jgi:putative PIN family toxin of toxin-antitoxin system